MGEEVRKGWLFKSLKPRARQDSVCWSWLVSRRVAVGKGEDREVRFIPRKKPDSEGRRMSESKKETPSFLEGWPGRGATEPFHNRVKGKSLWGDVTDSVPWSHRDLALLPPSWAALDKTLHSSKPQCLLCE